MPFQAAVVVLASLEFYYALYSCFLGPLIVELQNKLLTRRSLETDRVCITNLSYKATARARMIPISACFPQKHTLARKWQWQMLRVVLPRAVRRSGWVGTRDNLPCAPPCLSLAPKLYNIALKNTYQFMYTTVEAGSWEQHTMPAKIVAGSLEQQPYA
jgi:hypothetical protein